MNKDNFFAPVLNDKNSTKRKNKPGAGAPKKEPTVFLQKRVHWMKYDRLKILLNELADDELLLKMCETLAKERAKIKNRKDPDLYTPQDQHIVH